MAVLSGVVRVSLIGEVMFGKDLKLKEVRQ